MFAVYCYCLLLLGVLFALTNHSFTLFTLSYSQDKTYEELQNELAAKLAEQMEAMNPTVNKDSVDEALKEQKVAATQSKQELLSKVFKPHVEWTKHDYDTHERLYKQLCPTGGPGGLACCEVCSSAYSRYLNQTSQDIGVQSVHNAGTEVQECIGFMNETRNKLQKKVVVARKQAPPLKRDFAVSSSAASSNVATKVSGVQTASV